MSRAIWLGTAACLLSACDDGSLRAFEPSLLALGGSAGRGPETQAGAGRAGAPSGADGEAGAPGLPSPLLIDDFEDGDSRAQPPLGWWYPVNDKTSQQGFGIEPVSRDASVYALQTHGSGFRDWGAAVGVDLTGEAPAPLDLLGYRNLCFLARVDAGSSTLIQVHLLRGMLHYTRDVSVSETWTRYCVPLAEFTTLTGEPFVPNELIALQFFFPTIEPFTFWLDDVEVVRD